MILLAQLLYTALCATAIAAAFWLQAHRHFRAKACIYWSYSLLEFALVWEGIDTWLSGPPGFPASRWALLFALDVILVAAALKDRAALRDRNPSTSSS